jgi:hypothetical protein
MINVDSVHKSYDLGETSVHALRGVSFSIEKGEFVSIRVDLPEPEGPIIDTNSPFSILKLTPLSACTEVSPRS